MARRIFLTGGTGLIGSRLVKLLLARGDQPVVLTRRFAHARQALGTKVDLIEGDPMKPGAWTDTVASCDGVLHLAGENVFAKRWSASFKQMLVDSRVHSTRHIAEALARSAKTAAGEPKVLVNASAVGIYGPRGDEEITEESPPGDDFLAKLCLDWEKEARAVENAGVRSVEVRVGVVLDKEGGALAKLLTPFKMFVGGPAGSGRQYLAWIHHADMCGLFLFALDNSSCRGPLNGTAPNPVTNKAFSRALGQELRRPSFLPTPGFMLRIVLGEAANVITTGQRVVPRKALSLGYEFKFPTVEGALSEILSFMRADDLQWLDRDGYVLLRGALSPREAADLLVALAAALMRGAAILGGEGAVYAARNLLAAWPEVAEVVRRPPLGDVLAAALGPGFGVVRGLYFDKPPGQSWALPWHKDMTIAVRDNRLPTTRFAKPTTKAGVPHVEAPVELLERMLTARVHLDEVTDENGPLKVVPGSHRTGEEMHLDGQPIVTVYATAGDVLLMRPLLAHCSNRSREGTARHRRVLHLELAADAALPDGYEWHTFLPGLIFAGRKEPLAGLA